MTDLEREANTTDTLAAGLNGAMDKPKPGAPGRSWAHSLSEGRASLRSPYDYGREAAEAAQVCFMSETGPAPLAPWGIPYDRPAEPKADISAGLEYHSLSADFETRLAGAQAVLTKNKMFPGDASPLAVAFPEARNWRFAKAQIFDFPEVVDRVAKLRRSRSKKDWRETKPGSIRAYREARVEDGTRARERREYKIQHPEKVAEQKDRAAFRQYEKPFVSIDFEGQDRVGNDIEYLGVTYPDHRLFLGMAGGWARTNDPVSLDKIRKEGETNPAEKERHATLMREGGLLHFDAIGDATKRPRSSVENFEWMLGLPKKYGNAHFVMFSFNYDITQILADLPRAKVFEICKGRIFDGSSHGGRKFKAPVSINATQLAISNRRYLSFGGYVIPTNLLKTRSTGTVILLSISIPASRNGKLIQPII